MKIIKLLIFLSVVLFAVLFWFELSDFYFVSQDISQVQGQTSNFLVERVHRRIQSLTPLPLRLEEEQNFQSNLTRKGVIQWTNFQRAKYGLPPLKENSELDASSQVKVNDMFRYQYFAHESPQGLKVGDLTKEKGYQFIEVGENLALGNFKNDEGLVNAWMNSPGHRANILNPKYQDIGVTVKKGVFEGRTTWLAVQHFGFPLSACLQPSANLKKSIEVQEKKIDYLASELGKIKKDIQSTKFKFGPVYVGKIDYYNSLVVQYNNLVKESKILINKYNSQVKSFNACAEVSPS